ncbi:HEAT repeat domain-containing protein [Zhouia sp. PK063]|uniref:HEAT repeat domain-containing protein n=1 Tax=Zhouia sp. PK063 TaxID=3373602 RepID=UPI0037BC6A0D
MINKEWFQHIWDTVPWIVRLNLLLAAIFFSLVSFWLLFIVALRIVKNKRQKRKELLENEIIQFLNQNIFEEQLDEHVVKAFALLHLKTPYAKKIALKELLAFKENFRGEATNVLTDLYFQLGLDEFLEHKLQHGKWFQKARAIYFFSELKIQKRALIAPYLNTKKEEVREQAIFYFIKTSDTDPLDFLENLNEELNPWESIYLEDSLRYFYNGPVPDFSKWLYHKLPTVVMFAIRMIALYNQFENIPLITPFLQSHHPEVRKQAIKALSKLSYEELLDKILPEFPQEEFMVQQEIILAIKELGGSNDLLSLSTYITANTDARIQLAYDKAARYFKTLNSPA